MSSLYSPSFVAFIRIHIHSAQATVPRNRLFISCTFLIAMHIIAKFKHCRIVFSRSLAFSVFSCSLSRRMHGHNQFRDRSPSFIYVHEKASSLSCLYFSLICFSSFSLAASHTHAYTHFQHGKSAGLCMNAVFPLLVQTSS